MDTGTPGHGGALLRAQPPAASGHRSSLAGAEKREGSTGTHPGPDRGFGDGGKVPVGVELSDGGARAQKGGKKCAVRTA
jgi:hypothetical protein